jgi:hypothetical protein
MSIPTCTIGQHHLDSAPGKKPANPEDAFHGCSLAPIRFADDLNMGLAPEQPALPSLPQVTLVSTSG